MLGRLYQRGCFCQHGCLCQHDHAAPVIAVPALLILVGMLLRFYMLAVDVRFHPDEALFAAQARLISERGDLLLRDTDLDKPPLMFYMVAASFELLGPTEFAARLPNVIASCVSLALVYVLAGSLYHDRAAAGLVTLLLALSPYDLAFSATVFTDVQATCWGLAAAVLAVRDRWSFAGIALALAFACKPNALLVLPLVLALGLAANARQN
ncbi:MAG: glycosyltransferase family 39 protein, partial [Anaerolineae bacterium]|nr:glycosyltransferase family 39 protein [Anaerolineae bacterium]